ncbi:DUF1499 domain-containing protein [Nocardioidaceae bacterium]|nr:DUF1499 domain-containing protein [Nocardioidaceae bacterium]
MAAKRLSPCAEGSQKCVSTLDTQEYCAMDPVPFTGSPEQAKAAVMKVIADFPRTSVTTEEADYVSAVFKTKVLRFKDTVEFEIDADDNMVHFRSESVPYAGSDLGANRKRMTTVREQLVAALG